jgi:CubicO group peptidase (beta-lactamase class C family)
MLKCKNRFLQVIMMLILFSASGFSSMECFIAEPEGYCKQAIITARREIWQKINAGGAGSGSVAIMDNGSLMYFEGFGMSNREKRIPVNADTVFNIASVSKVFTAAAIMRLVDSDRVDLDTPVINYLKSFSMADPRYREITVRMLLNHTSGIPGTTMANTDGYSYNTMTNDLILENLRQSHLIHKPGAFAVYCNDGFSLAEMIVEVVSGKTFADFLTDEILIPLKLEKTGVAADASEKGIPAIYYAAADGEARPLEIVSALGAGGLSANVLDLCRFADCFSDEGNHIFSPTSLKEMKLPQPCKFSDKVKNDFMSFGLGWDYTNLPQYKTEGIQVLGKSGDSMHYGTMLFTVPAIRLSVAVTMTGTEPEAIKIAGDLLKDVLVGKGIFTNSEEKVSLPVLPQALPEDYAKYDGYYVGSSGNLSRICVDSENDRVNIHSFINGEMLPAATFYYNNGNLYDEPFNENYYYFLSTENKDYLMLSALGTDYLYMEKLEALSNPRSLIIDIEGKQWLRRNVRPFEINTLASNHIQVSHSLENLPGYSFFNGIQRIESPYFANYAANTMREQKDLTLFKQEGNWWAQTFDLLYSSAEKVTVLEKPSVAIAIGKKGYSEWLRIPTTCFLTVKISGTGKVIVFSSDGSVDTIIHEEGDDNGMIFIEEGSFIEFVGNPGDIFSLERD